MKNLGNKCCVISVTNSSLLYRIVQNFGEGKLGVTIVIRQYFTQPNSRFTIGTNGSYCKFANVFLAKTLKRSIRQSFTPPTFCAIRHIGKSSSIDVTPATPRSSGSIVITTTATRIATSSLLKYWKTSSYSWGLHTLCWTLFILHSKQIL